MGERAGQVLSSHRPRAFAGLLLGILFCAGSNDRITHLAAASMMVCCALRLCDSGGVSSSRASDVTWAIIGFVACFHLAGCDPRDRAGAMGAFLAFCVRASIYCPSVLVRAATTAVLAGALSYAREPLLAVTLGSMPWWTRPTRGRPRVFSASTALIYSWAALVCCSWGLHIAGHAHAAHRIDLLLGVAGTEVNYRWCDR